MKSEALQPRINHDLPHEEFGNGVLLSDHVRIAVEDYFAQIEGYPVNDLYAIVITEVEKPLIETVLDYARHNQSKAAKVLGLSRSTLRKKMTQYGLE